MLTLEEDADRVTGEQRPERSDGNNPIVSW